MPTSRRQTVVKPKSHHLCSREPYVVKAHRFVHCMEKSLGISSSPSRLMRRALAELDQALHTNLSVVSLDLTSEPSLIRTIQLLPSSLLLVIRSVNNEMA